MVNLDGAPGLVSSSFWNIPSLLLSSLGLNPSSDGEVSSSNEVDDSIVGQRE